MDVLFYSGTVSSRVPDRQTKKEGMPKELIHFKVAQMTAGHLAGTRLGQCADASPQGLLVGAVFHDVLFYAVTAKARPVKHLAHALHGADGQDTFALLRLQAAHAASVQDSGLAAALLVGMTSHLYADATMHPMVWHLSGDYYADEPKQQSLARQRHRALESLMDMVTCPATVGKPLFSLRRLLRSLGPDLYDAIPVRHLADMAISSQKSMREGLSSSFRIYAMLQAALGIRPLARSFHALMPLLPDSAREITTLFYAPQLMRQSAEVSGGIRHNHPVTGLESTASLDEMVEEAAHRAATACRAMEPGIFEGKPLDFPGTGPSLDAGLPDTPTTAMRRFASSPFPELP